MEKNKEYIALEENEKEFNYLKLEVAFSKYDKAYVLRATPIFLDGHSERHIIDFQPRNDTVILKQVGRQSDKAFAESIELASSKKEELIKTVLSERNLKLKKEVKSKDYDSR